MWCLKGPWGIVAMILILQMRKLIKEFSDLLELFTSRAMSDVASCPVAGVFAISEHTFWNNQFDNFVLQTKIFGEANWTQYVYSTWDEASAARVWDK